MDSLKSSINCVLSQVIVDGTDPYPACCVFPTGTPVTVEALLAGVRILPVGG